MTCVLKDVHVTVMSTVIRETVEMTHQSERQMNIQYCDECKAFHSVNVKKDVMYFDDPEILPFSNDMN